MPSNITGVQSYHISPKLYVLADSAGMSKVIISVHNCAGRFCRQKRSLKYPLPLQCTNRLCSGQSTQLLVHWLQVQSMSVCILKSQSESWFSLSGLNCYCWLDWYQKVWDLFTTKQQAVLHNCDSMIHALSCFCASRMDTDETRHTSVRKIRDIE